MKKTTHKYQARRRFLKRAAHMALLGAGAGAVNAKMSLIGSALAAADDYSNLPGYKALVCIYLSGGSDSFNMFVPYDQGGYNEYRDARGPQLTIPRADLLADAAGQIGFHPNLGALRDQYNAGNLAVVRNVGNLFVPVTPAQYRNNPERVPADLFAHNSQTEQVQKSWSSRPVGLVSAGWGGRMADLLSQANQGNALPPSFSMSNSNFFLPGRSQSPISVNPRNGPSLLPYLDEQRSSRNRGRASAMEQILNLPTSHAMESFAATSFRNARDSSRILNSVIGANPPLWQADANNRLDVQLRMIARMIAGRNDMGARRQVFFARLGGWDTHHVQNGRLINLSSQLNAAMQNFQQALATLGVENEVTTFTASEFGRTLTINGDGTDHAWGGHYAVMGGSVNGGQMYGNWPEYALGGRDDIGNGRIIPQMSINQLGASLGSWMGLSNTDLLDIFPDLRRFDNGWQNRYGMFS